MRKRIVPTDVRTQSVRHICGLEPQKSGATNGVSCDGNGVTVLFGYIRPVQSELLVKESNFYDAVYCGLCRYSGKHLTHASRYLLNYDFTFLSVLRLSLTGSEVRAEKVRCPYKLHKKQAIVCDEVFAYTASAFGLFSYYKLEDDLRDEKGFSRFCKRLLRPFFKRMRRKSQKVCGYPGMEEQIRLPIEELHRLEEANCDSPDRAADCFGRILRDVASAGLEGDKKAIAEQCGYHIGRFIYLIDAYDDFISDDEKGCYNPFLAKYGSVTQVFLHESEIRQTLIDSMNVFSHSYALACGPVLTGMDRILFNICDLGGREAIRKVEEKLNKEKGRLETDRDQ